MNKKPLKKIKYKLCVLTFLVILSMLTGCFVMMDEPWRDATDMEEELQENITYISIVRDFLMGLAYEYDTDVVRVGRSWSDEPHNVWLGTEHGRFPIESEEILGALNTLFENGFGVIRLTANHVIFQRWSNLDRGRGALYLFEGDTPIVSDPQTVVTIEPLSLDGWYYFVSTFVTQRRATSETSEQAVAPHPLAKALMDYKEGNIVVWNPYYDFRISNDVYMAELVTLDDRGTMGVLLTIDDGMASKVLLYMYNGELFYNSQGWSHHGAFGFGRYNRLASTDSIGNPRIYMLVEAGYFVISTDFVNGFWADDGVFRINGQPVTEDKFRYTLESYGVSDTWESRGLDQTAQILAMTIIGETG